MVDGWLIGGVDWMVDWVVDGWLIGGLIDG